MSGLDDLDIYRLAEMWAHGEIDTDRYFAIVEQRAKEAVEAEIRAEGLRRRKGTA